MKRLLYFLLLLVFVLTGCVLEFEDVSQEPEYAPYIGSSYSLNTKMLIYGVNLPPGYGEDVNVYIITPDIPSMTGPEIITREHLNSAETLMIQSVRRSTNHFPGNQDIAAIVEIQSYEKSADVPVVIDLRYIQSTNYMQRVER
jgi:hypothetical protein